MLSLTVVAGAATLPLSVSAASARLAACVRYKKHRPIISRPVAAPKARQYGRRRRCSRRSNRRRHRRRLIGALDQASDAVERWPLLGALLFAAIGVVVQLKDALNTVWEVEETPGHGTWHFIRSYVVSLAAVLALGFLLLVSLMVTTGLAAFSKYAAPHLAEWLLHLISSLVSLAVITLLFAMMFKWLPDAAVRWSDVWLGALVTVAVSTSVAPCDAAHRD